MYWAVMQACASTASWTTFSEPSCRLHFRWNNSRRVSCAMSTAQQRTCVCIHYRDAVPCSLLRLLIITLPIRKFADMEMFCCVKQISSASYQGDIIGNTYDEQKISWETWTACRHKMIVRCAYLSFVFGDDLPVADSDQSTCQQRVSVFIQYKWCTAIGFTKLV